MKNSKTINVMKSFILVILLALSFVSCKKDGLPGNGPGKGVTDYHQTAVTQFIAAGETKFAYRVL